MSTPQSPSPEAEPLPDAPTLPFLYEDLSDGRYERLLAEARAAREWSRRRRASGHRPN